MMKVGGRGIVQKSRPNSNLGVVVPLGAHPPNVAFGYDVGKITAGCLFCCCEFDAFNPETCRIVQDNTLLGRSRSPKVIDFGTGR